MEASLVSRMAASAGTGQSAETSRALNDYAQLQGTKAVNIAAHTHVIEFGVLCMLMALFQPYVYLTEKWRRIWALVLLAGSLMLPVFVLLEMRWGLLAGGMADAGGLLVILGLTGMLAGIVRYTGRSDAAPRGLELSAARKLLIRSGLLLAVWGMAYGFYYAVFVEHQMLDRIGGSLASGFTFAAGRNLAASEEHLQEFAKTTYIYVRQVDAHGHWIGLSMLLVLFGALFHRVDLGGKAQLWLAWGLVSGAISFPLGVLLETVNGGWGPKLLAACGSAVMIVALAGAVLGFARHTSAAPRGMSGSS
jgi:hypothetical protein